MKDNYTYLDLFGRAYGIGAILLAASLLAACQKAPVALAFDKFCDATLDGKKVQVDGYLAVNNFTFCGEDSWGRARCPLSFQGTSSAWLGADHALWVYLGDEANRMHMPQSTERDKLVVYGNDGKQLDIARAVRVTGELGGPDQYSDKCSIDLDSIEQANETKPKPEIAPGTIMEYKLPSQ